MHFSHFRLDGPLDLLPRVHPLLTKYCSGYVVGHERSKGKAKKLHFHMHLEHKIHIDNLRKAFRKVLPKEEFKFALSNMRSFCAKNIAYCIKGSLVTFEGIEPEVIAEAKLITKKIKKEKGWTLVKKCRLYIEEVLSAKYLAGDKEQPDVYLEKISDKRVIIKHALDFFKARELSYPLRSWMDKLYIEILMENGYENLAINYYE